METVKEENKLKKQKELMGNRTGNALYRTVWRLHFYAGLIFAPFLMILAVTGSVYLFKPQIEQVLYQDYYEVTPQGDKIPASRQIEAIKKLYPDAVVTKYRPGENATRSSEVSISSHHESRTIFINPYTGKSLGELKDEDRIMDKIEEFHGELMAGTLGDRIVELAACWAIVLICNWSFFMVSKTKEKFVRRSFSEINKRKKGFSKGLACSTRILGDSGNVIFDSHRSALVRFLGK